MIYYIVKGGGKFFKKFKLGSAILRSPRKDIYNDAYWTTNINEAHIFKTKIVAQRCAKVYNGEVIDQIKNEFE